MVKWESSTYANILIQKCMSYSSNAIEHITISVYITIHEKYSRANITQHGQMILIATTYMYTYYMHTDKLSLKISHLRNLSWLPQITNGSVIQINAMVQYIVQMTDRNDRIPSKSP